MEIHIDEIHAYLHCPSKYKIKHLDKLQSQENRRTLFKQGVHKTIDYFFFSVMNEQLPSLAKMKDKWADTCSQLFHEKVGIEDIFASRPGYNPKKANRHRNISPEQVKGMEMIHHFYHFNKDNPGVPIAVDMEYRVPIGDFTVVGRFELVREVKDPEDNKRYIEIVDFKTEDKALDYFLVKNDINLTLASYAFRKLFNGKEDRLKYHYLNTGRDIIVTKTQSDFNRLEAIINGVGESIKQKHYYPRQTFMCSSCEVKDICDRMKF